MVVAAPRRVPTALSPQPSASQGAIAMQMQTQDELTHKKCVPCEGGVPKYSREEAEEQLHKLNGWQISADGQRIRNEWTVKNFMAGIRFFNDVARLAEDEGHH